MCGAIHRAIVSPRKHDANAGRRFLAEIVRLKRRVRSRSHATPRGARGTAARARARTSATAASVTAQARSVRQRPSSARALRSRREVGWKRWSRMRYLFVPVVFALGCASVEFLPSASGPASASASASGGASAPASASASAPASASASASPSARPRPRPRPRPPPPPSPSSTTTTRAPSPKRARRIDCSSSTHGHRGVTRASACAVHVPRSEDRRARERLRLGLESTPRTRRTLSGSKRTRCACGRRSSSSTRRAE